MQAHGITNSLTLTLRRRIVSLSTLAAAVNNVQKSFAMLRKI